MGWMGWSWDIWTYHLICEPRWAIPTGLQPKTALATLLLHRRTAGSTLPKSAPWMMSRRLWSLAVSWSFLRPSGLLISSVSSTIQIGLFICMLLILSAVYAMRIGTKIKVWWQHSHCTQAWFLHLLSLRVNVYTAARDLKLCQMSAETRRLSTLCMNMSNTERANCRWACMQITVPCFFKEIPHSSFTTLPVTIAMMLHLGKLHELNHWTMCICQLVHL